MADNQKFHDNENFRELVRKRARMIWPLSAFLVVALAGNLYLMSSGAELGARKISENSVITIALAYSLLLILVGALIAGFYVQWANKHLDPLMDKVRSDIASSERGE